MNEATTQILGQEVTFRSGDVVLFRNEFVWNRPVTYLSAAIRAFTGVEYNHAAVVVMCWGVPYLVENRGGGVRSRPLEKYLRRYRTRIKVLRPGWTFDEEKYCARALSAQGIGYGFRDLLFYQPLYRITGRWLGATGDRALEDGVVCTEFAAWTHGLQFWFLYSAREFLSNRSFTDHYTQP